jgi:hypothetical protein
LGPQHTPLNSTTHRSDWDIDTINSKQLQRIGPAGMEHRFRSSPHCSAVDASHHKLPGTKTSLLPRSKENLLPTTFFPFFFSHSTTKKEKEEKQTTEEHVLTKRSPPKHHGRAEVSDRDAQCCLQEGYDARRANDTIPSQRQEERVFTCIIIAEQRNQPAPPTSPPWCC